MMVEAEEARQALPLRLFREEWAAVEALRDRALRAETLSRLKAQLLSMAEVLAVAVISRFVARKYFLRRAWPIHC
eukprot:SAG11_NODE_1500_length_4787_cov_1.409556_3_plen_75_part_00